MFLRKSSRNLSKKDEISSSNSNDYFIFQSNFDHDSKNSGSSNQYEDKVFDKTLDKALDEVLSVNENFQDV